MTLTTRIFFLLLVIRKNLTFRKPLDFLSAIYDGKISLNEAEIMQRGL